LVMTIDQKDYLLNGETKQMDTAPIVLTGRTLIPLRFAGEALGCQVDWFAETNEILVTFALDAPEENKPGTSLGGSEVSIVDVMGHTVTLAAPASKVVGTHNPTLNQLVILGGGGKYIAGFGNKNMAGSLYALVYPELEEEVVQIGSGQNINFETVLAVEADLAIVPERFAGLVERFEEINVPAAVVLPSNESFDTIRESLLRVATLIGEDERAAEIIAFFDSTVSAVAAVVAEHEDHPTMIFTGSSSQLSVANGTLLQSEIMEAVGGINVAKEASGSGGFSNVSIEEIIGWDPEIIYIPVYASFTVEDILSDPAWASISAVQNERVYVFPSALEPWDYPTPSVALGLVWLLNNLYPEAYTLDQVLADAAAYYDLVYGQTFTAEQLGLK
ncbi:MAG: ABC transporter substrate-binding protein, partial [Symbiobacteriaceae bacterium]|nr:ABC transporter substrate-binding protein [Symbiobacteriaceae bacterium]